MLDTGMKDTHQNPSEYAANLQEDLRTQCDLHAFIVGGRSIVMFISRKDKLWLATPA